MKLRYWYKIDHKKQPIPGSNIRRKSRPGATHQWKEILDPCCSPNVIDCTCGPRYFVQLDGRGKPVDGTLIKRVDQPKNNLPEGTNGNKLYEINWKSPCCIEGPIPDFNFAGLTNIHFGDSITAGVGASSEENRYVNQFNAAKESNFVNNGISGMVLQTNYVGSRDIFDPNDIPTYVNGLHGKLFIALGVNDVGVNNNIMTPEEFETDYQAAIVTAVGKGWLPVNIVLVTPFYYTGFDLYLGSDSVTIEATNKRLEDYVQKVYDLANLNKTLLVDVYSPARDFTNSMTLISNTDYVHPTPTGMDFHSNTFINTYYGAYVPYTFTPTSYPLGTTDIILDNDPVDITQTAFVTEPATINTNFDHYGIYNTFRQKGVRTSARVYFQYKTGQDNGTTGFKNKKSYGPYTDITAGILIDSSIKVTIVELGIVTELADTPVNNRYYGIYTDGSVFKAQYSDDLITWTDIQTLTPPDVSDLYPALNVYGTVTSKITNPKFTIIS